MLAIARALMSEPDILLLDELSMGLAPLMVNLYYMTCGIIFIKKIYSYAMWYKFCFIGKLIPSEVL
jgi:ABC-type multidrug transport system fused ATPase/permease subunit